MVDKEILMSMVDAAFEWVRSRVGGTYSMPLPMEDPSRSFDTGNGKKPNKLLIVPAPDKEKPKRSITREEAKSFLVECEYCGISQFLEEGYCSRCGSPLPEPVVPEVIIEAAPSIAYPPANSYSTGFMYEIVTTGEMTGVLEEEGV